LDARISLFVIADIVDDRRKGFGRKATSAEALYLDHLSARREITESRV
jgi:hypothetical protein